MAVKYSIGTGNWTTAGTWGVVDATSYLNAEHATESLLTTAYSGTRSVAFTPGAITVSHLLVKLCERIGTTGTMSVSLRNATIGADDFVTGTEVTVNVADLPTAFEADINGGWIAFKLASPVLLLAATDYNMQAKTSSTNQVDLWCDATADNLSRCLVTTTTGAPAAGDDFIIAGELTGAGTSNAFVVTGNETATTDYGSASTSLVTPAIAICHLGTLRSQVTAATAYNLKVSGNIILYAGGSLEVATVASPMPRDSMLDIVFDCGANVDFGLTVRNDGTWIMQGQSRTVSKLVDRCLLNTNAALNATSLGVNTDTGWLDNDVIAVGPTSRTAAQCESGTLNGNAGASSLTVDGFAGSGGGVLNAHSGTTPTQAEVILLTRNVRIRGASATQQAYIDIKPGAIVDCDWTEFKWLGSATANKRGIDIGTTTGSATFDHCSVWDGVVTGSRGFPISAASGTGIALTNCVTFNINSEHLINVATSGYSTFAGCLAMRNVANVAIALFGDAGTIVTDLTIVGCASNSSPAVYIFEVNSVLSGTFQNIVSHSNAFYGIGVYSSVRQTGTLGPLTAWRNSATGLAFLSNTSAPAGLTVSGATLFGNTPSNVLFFASAAGITINDLVSNGDTTFATTSGVTFNTVTSTDVALNNAEFSTVAGILTAHTQDILLLNTAITRIIANGCLFGASVEVNVPAGSPAESFVRSQNHDRVEGAVKNFYGAGTVTTDTTIYGTASPSLRITPASTSQKQPLTILRAAVNDGETATVSVKVRESVSEDGTAYNGNRIRLMVRANWSMGITADTILDIATSASEGGTGEVLSGTTATVTSAGVLEFYVDCDGTTGWINVDDVTLPTARDTTGFLYGIDGEVMAYGNNSTGGGVPIIIPRTIVR